MKVYEGKRDADGVAHVTVNGQPLAPRFDLKNHSPSGLEWGYGGSGPSQLALALCADVAGDARALEVYQHFKWQVVAKMKQGEGWRRTDIGILHEIEVLEGKHHVGSERPL